MTNFLVVYVCIDYLITLHSRILYAVGGVIFAFVILSIFIKIKHETIYSCLFLTSTLYWDMVDYLTVCVHGQSCLILCHPMDYSPPGSSVHGIFQTRILKQVAISCSRGSSQPRDQTGDSCVSCIAMHPSHA